MSVVQLHITYVQETASMKASLFSEGEKVAEKNLTSVEMEGLSDYIDFDLLDQILDASEVYKWITEDCWFDTNGEATNLELMLEDHLP